MPKSLLSNLLPMLIPVLLLAGCGWNTGNSLGEHSQVVNSVSATNVVGGRVVHNLANAVIESVGIDTSPAAATYTIGTNGSFAISNVNGTARVIAGLVVGNNRQQLYSRMSTPPSPTADIITTYRNDWNGVTDMTIEVNGNSSPVHVTQLTDIVYRPQNSATLEDLNTFLNEYFATTNIDYVANPEPSREVTAVACSRFPR